MSGRQGGLLRDMDEILVEAGNWIFPFTKDSVTLLPSFVETSTGAPTVGQNSPVTWFDIKALDANRYFLVQPRDRVEIRPPRNEGRASLESCLSLLTEYIGLPPNWDSYGARPITPGAVERARHLLSLLFDTFNKAGLPDTVVPIADGGIQFEWSLAGSTLEVEIQSDGALNTLLLDEGQEAQEHDRVNWHDIRESLARLVKPEE